MSKTNAMRFLGGVNVAFEVREYLPKINGAEFAAEALDIPLGQLVKTLIVKLSDKRIVACCMPGDRSLSLKKLARALGVKNAQMAAHDKAQQATGYRVGGISPFGTKGKLQIYYDESIRELNRIGINAGKRGTILWLDPTAAFDAADATPYDLST